MATINDECTSTKRHVHMIGIGGMGMSPLAQLLSASGVHVTGSDVRDSPTIQMLRELNILVYIGHAASQIEGSNAIIVSPAVPRNNRELKAAHAIGLPIFSRAEALAELIRARVRVCVTGSHGKTTTTAILASLMENCGQDSGYMIGGPSPSLGVNAKWGSGFFVLEACEAFGALHNWQADHCIITNLDDEHSDHYGDFLGLKLAFRDFMERVTPCGTILVCGDDGELVAIGKETSRDIITYGLSEGCNFRAVVEKTGRAGSTFNVFREERLIGQMTLPIPGEHNIRNALAAVAMATCLGVAIPSISSTLSRFRGVERRCQLIASVDNIEIYDDYAHHPTEVQATLSVARSAAHDGGRVMVVFEGLLHSRVQRFAASFAAALACADFVAILPTDAAGESNFEPSEDRLSGSLAQSGVSFIHTSTSAQAASEMIARLKPGDVMVAIGPKLAKAVGSLVSEGLEQRKAKHGAISDILSIARGPVVEANAHGTILHRFREHVLSQPNALATMCGSERLSCAELALKAKKLASQLQEAGVRQGEIVAVQLPRSNGRVVAFLGVLLAGAVYLPIDPETPSDRFDFILADARIGVLITDHSTRQLPNVLQMPFSELSTHPVPEMGWDILPSPSDGAYVIFTSGTTGTPKGVIVEHAALLNVARTSATKFDIVNSNRISQISSYGFDIAVGDMALGIYSGAALIFPDESSAQPGSPMGRYISDSAITHLSLTPSMLSTVPLGHYNDLTHIIVCGEKCPPDLAARWMVDYRFFNAYGPAEATVWCTVEECHVGSAVTIGRPLDNISIALLDEHQRPVAVGIEGEIWIFGLCLARGYLNRDELTRERFRTINIDSQTVRAYRTGDIAVIDTDERLHFLGRIDNQIKIRGFRVEPGEIEEALRRHPNVTAAAVRLHKDRESIERLVAHLVTKENELLSVDSITKFLSAWLPSHMIPSAIRHIQSLPRNQNQKLDYRSLPNPFLEMRSNDKGLQKARTGTEKAIIKILKSEFLSIEECGISDTFTSLGMDSLQSARFFAAVERLFEIQLPSEAYAQANTVELVAIYVDKAAAGLMPVLKNQSLVNTIVRKQLTHFAAWTGARVGSESLICGHNLGGMKPPLYWCFQGNNEHETLARHLGISQPLYGMRSAHLVFRYKDENIRVLAEKYADEMIALQSAGSFVLGGNCQGGIIAHATAAELHRRGRDVSLLCLLGPTRFSAFPRPVSLIFSENSRRNPYLTMLDPERVFRSAYGTSYAVTTIPGDDESQFVEPNVVILAERLSSILSGVTNQNSGSNGKNDAIDSPPLEPVAQ